MLQRIQTIWLLLAGVAALLTFKFPFFYLQGATIPQKDELNGLNAGFPVLITSVVITILAFTAIGLYKSRTAQLRLCVVGILLELLLVFFYYKASTAFTKPGPSVYLILHVLIIISFMLAARGINKDEKLIKESDRLR